MTGQKGKRSLEQFLAFESLELCMGACENRDLVEEDSHIRWLSNVGSWSSQTVLFGSTQPSRPQAFQYERKRKRRINVMEPSFILCNSYVILKDIYQSSHLFAAFRSSMELILSLVASL